MKNTDKKMKHGMVALITLLSLTVVTFAIVLYAYFIGETEKSNSQSYVGEGAINALATETVSVKINMENCMMKVGTKTQVSATIYPDGSNSGIIWSSSDENVFTVDSKGNIEVIGTGIVALTATFGTATDSIAIECIANEEEAVLQLPDYSAFKQNETATAAATASANETTKSGSTEDTSKQPSSSMGTPTSTQAPTNGTTAARPTTTPTTERASGATASTTNATTYSAETTTEYGGTKVSSTEIAEQLTGYGFTKYLDNTYVYGESDAYLGEIIITSNMTHIYVKEASTAFDGAISSVLTVLLPDSYGTVWNVYNSASADQTMTLDGRVVRVVVPADGGHKQIVVYN